MFICSAYLCLNVSLSCSCVEKHNKSRQSSKDSRKILVFYCKAQPFVKLYDIELGDQEFFTQFISIDILWAHRLHICAPVEKAIDGLSISLWTDTIVWYRSVFAPQGSILSLCSQWKSCAHNCGCTQLWMHTTGKGGRDAARSSILLTSGPRRQTNNAGRVGASITAKTPRCHGGGSASSPWKPSLSSI